MKRSKLSWPELNRRSWSAWPTDPEAPHLSGRAYCYALRFGYQDADFLLVKKSRIRKYEGPRDQLQEALDTGHFGLPAVGGEFSLWKRGHSAERNATGRRASKLRPPPKKIPELHPTAP